MLRFAARLLLFGALFHPAPVGAGDVYWINALGGDWSDPGNWSGGAVPDSSDSVFITLDGTYTVILDVNPAVTNLTLGAASGVQTLSGTGRTLTVTGAAQVLARGVLVLDTSTVNGSGSLTNSGTVVTRGTGGLDAPFSMQPGSLLSVEGSAGGPAVLTVAGGFTTSGTIELTNTAAGASARLAVASGTLANAPGGVILSLPGAGGGDRTLTAGVDNQGNVTVSHALTIDAASADHLNSGTIDVSGGDLAVSHSGTTPSFSTSGSISVAPGRTLTFSGSGTAAWTQTAGSVSGSGGLVLDHQTASFSSLPATSSLTVLTSTVSWVQLLSTASTQLSGTNSSILGGGVLNVFGVTTVFTGCRVYSPLYNEGALFIRGNPSNFNGSFTTGSQSFLHLEGTPAAGDAVLTVANSFVNNGVIDLSNTAAGYSATLALTTGTLTNAGDILFQAGFGGGNRVLTAQLLNGGSGALETHYAGTIDRASADHVNNGAINVTAGDLTVIHSGTTPSFSTSGTITIPSGRTLAFTGTGTAAWSKTAGTVSGAGTLSLYSQTATFNAGPTVSNLTLTGGTVSFSTPFSTAASLNLTGTTINGASLTLAAGGNAVFTTCIVNPALNNQGDLTVRGSPSEFNGAFTTSGGSILRLEGVFGIGTAGLTVAQGFTNNGTIELTNNYPSRAASLTVSAGTLTNASGGAINSLPGAGGGGRTLTAQLFNSGSVTVSHNLTLERSSADHVSSGSIYVTGGNLTVTQSGSTPTFTNNGDITIGAGRTLRFNSGTTRNAVPGLITGTGILGVSTSAFTNSGTIRPGLSPGQLTVTGNAVFDSTSVIDLEVAGLSPGAGYDRLAVSLDAALNGTLRVGLSGGFVPAPGDTFRVMTYSSRAGTFREVSGLGLGNDLYLVPVPGYPDFAADGITVLTVRQAWDPLAPAGPMPAGRSGHSAVFDEGSGRMIVFGGETGGGVQNDTWLLTFATGVGGTPEWQPLSPIGGPPPARTGHSAVYDPSSNSMIVFGGDDGPGGLPGHLEDVWILSNANGLGGPPVWTDLLPAGFPGGRSRHTAVYNASSNRMVVFGGDTSDDPCDAPLGDVWILTGANGQGFPPEWVPLFPSGGPPPARAGHVAAYDAASNRMIVTGGSIPCAAVHGDGWVLAGADGLGPAAWSPGLANDPAPARTGHAGVLDAGVNRLIVFGGQVEDQATLSDETLLFSQANALGGPSWWAILPPTTSAPESRHGHSLVYDQAARRMTLFGGAWVSGLLSDVWVLHLSGGDGEVSASPGGPDFRPPAKAGFTRAPWPNPCRGPMSFVLSMDRDRTVDVTVHDAAGRLVDRILTGRLDAGDHAMAWAGRTSLGRPVPAGVYWLSLRTSRESVARRFVVVP